MPMNQNNQTASSSKLIQQPTNLRKEIVNVLSNTVNGCISELGYYPRMQEELQNAINLSRILMSERDTVLEQSKQLCSDLAQAESERAHLQTQNKKLYEDNCRMMQDSIQQQSRYKRTADKLLIATHENTTLKMVCMKQTNGKNLITMVMTPEVQQAHARLAKYYNHGRHHNANATQAMMLPQSQLMNVQPSPQFPPFSNPQQPTPFRLPIQGASADHTSSGPSTSSSSRKSSLTPTLPVVMEPQMQIASTQSPPKRMGEFLQPEFSKKQKIIPQQDFIQLDQDGLVPVEDCVNIMMDEEDSNKPDIKTCRLCTSHSKGGIIEKPKPFIGASLQQLVEHCVQEHETYWSFLRNTTQA